MPPFLPLTRRDLLTGSALLAGAALLPRVARAAVGEGTAVSLSAGPGPRQSGGDGLSRHGGLGL
ncbi:exported protein of unknown function [Azospirillum baldaniorum]|uniref:Uncharacterized protein n=1 Tax=Azospirillum baldaniorum TaxID=1064539 RepID=A0A9P1JN09_9PROT|nr:exported protein of unknown function [Azospirillum baldaniorum]